MLAHTCLGVRWLYEGLDLEWSHGFLQESKSGLSSEGRYKIGEAKGWG